MTEPQSEGAQRSFNDLINWERVTENADLQARAFSNFGKNTNPCVLVVREVVRTLLANDVDPERIDLFSLGRRGSGVEHAWVNVEGQRLDIPENVKVYEKLYPRGKPDLRLKKEIWGQLGISKNKSVDPKK